VIHFTRCYRFPAAHVLSSPRLSEQENRRIFGPCANPSGHGHDYRVEVTVAGPVDEDTGRIVPPEVLDEVFDQTVRDVYSHRLLNELDGFSECLPTAENLAQAMFGALAPELARRSRARLARVRIRETSHNHFDYGELG
jgi:6-pyruvoyltetrahydropterin/6-carboxytetrahydropterin synthase